MGEQPVAAIDMAQLQSWVGRQESRTDVITAAPVLGLSATLDYAQTRAGKGEPLLPLWHWLYFLPAPAASAIAEDGHPRRGGFLPPVPLLRRMWAGSSIRFTSPLAVGDEVRRVSSITDVTHKQGQSGELVFVTLRHQLHCRDTLALEEEQQLVYRQQDPGGGSPAVKPAPADAQWSRELVPDPVLLFRYSALTFNSHRIHYDRDYAVNREGYAGLVVQGPLTATLLLDLLHRELPGKRLSSFRFRSVKPLIASESMLLQGRCDGKEVRLWALDAAGALAMDAQAVLL